MVIGALANTAALWTERFANLMRDTGNVLVCAEYPGVARRCVM
jgi:hypothetical protein